MPSDLRPTAIVIADSIGETAPRLPTIHARYWRPIHSEVLTHRVFNRNGRSSRAVPVKRLLSEPIMEPLVYGMNQPGMSAGGDLTGWRLWAARAIWIGMAQMTRLGVRGLLAVGLHKQWANRPLEWAGCIDMLFTATDWRNFMALRIDDGAQPEIRALAEAMRDAMEASTPRFLDYGEWHLPYILPDERQALPIDLLRKISTARCARLSYAPFDGRADHASEVARHDRLVVSQPVHASPAEHIATPRRPGSGTPHKGNLRGWDQYRHMLPNESVPESLTIEL